MGPLIRVSFDTFKEIEKRAKYRFGDKERQRSNRAAGFAANGAIAKRCLMNHENTIWVGPPHDKVRAYVCADCHAAASEPEIRDRGFEFESCPDWEYKKIFDLDLQRQAQGNITSYPRR